MVSVLSLNICVIKEDRKLIWDSLKNMLLCKKKEVIFVPEYRRNNESEGDIYFRSLQLSWE